jgi:site-specific DNA-methyltransferase (adenine-specific)
VNGLRVPVLVHGDCLDVLRELPENSVDAIVTDPPYGLGFMGKKWDDLPPGEEWAKLCLHVLKPGGHLLAFGGTRTWHRLACAVEDAGFEMRDSIAWLYGSGFPKSLDVSKAIDKAAGATREVKPWLRKDVDGEDVFSDRTTTATSGNLQCPECLKWKFAPDHCRCPRDNGAQTDDARRWQGWGTALKPAFEPIVVARKPLVGTVAANVLEHGTGALNIDACRVGSDPIEIHRRTDSEVAASSMAGRSTGSTGTGEFRSGRWPANVILDESQAQVLDQQSGNLNSGGSLHERSTSAGVATNISGRGERKTSRAPDSGGASRFFFKASSDDSPFLYVAKAPKKERPKVDDIAHPTVKPLTLMRWLVRLVTPPGGTVLDPFGGSGATAEAAMLEGFDCIIVEREADYLPLIRERVVRNLR